jgi:hypothetical protein
MFLANLHNSTEAKQFAPAKPWLGYVRSLDCGGSPQSSSLEALVTS